MSAVVTDVSVAGKPETMGRILIANVSPGCTASGAVTEYLRSWSASLFGDSEPPYARQMTCAVVVVVTTLGVKGPLDASAVPANPTSNPATSGNEVATATHRATVDLLLNMLPPPQASP